jgi:hypothetical protein
MIPIRSIDPILKAINEAIREYPDLISEVLSFCNSCNDIDENNVKKSFIELKGKLPVEYKGNTYGVNMSIMIPEGFPAKAPFVMIIN